MEKWLKIEKFINQLLTRVYGLLGKLISQKTPGQIKDAAKKTQSNVKKSSEKTKIWCKSSLTRTFTPVKMFFKNFGYHVAKIKTKMMSLTSGLKTSIPQIKKNPKEKIILFLSTLFMPFFVKIKEWLISIKPLTMALGISLSTLLGLTIFSIYQAQQKMAKEPDRQIASEGKGEMSTDMVSQARAEYYNLHEKFIKILNIHVPIYIESVHSFRSVQLDFVIIPSNRYIREYFYENEYLVHDRLNVMVEPVVPEMPLDDEGRQIIREKIKYELNELLKDLKIKGSIEEIYIDSILGA